MRGLVQKPMLGDECMSDGTNPGDRNNVLKMLFNEGSGGQVFDLSGNGNTGTLVNSPAWVAGIDGSALRFVAATHHEISLAGATGLTSDAWTIVARIKADDQADCVLCGWDDVQPNVYLQTSTIGKPIFYMGPDNYQYIVASAWTKIKDGNWHIVAASMPGNANADITSAKFYVDGVSYALDAGGSGGAPTAKVQLNLFAPKQLINREFDGDASWFLYFNRVLSASEIALLYREPFCDLGPRMMNLYVPAAVGGISMPLVMQQMNHFSGGMAA